MPTNSESQSSTKTLIARGKAGDQSAWNRVIGRLTRRLRGWAHGRVPRSARGAHETADIVQDATIGVWKRMDQLDLRRPGDLEAYVRQAVVNRIRDEVRKTTARPRPVTLEDRYEDPSISPLGEVLSREAMERYQRAFGELDVSDREAVIARIDMGYSYDQVAALTGKSSAAAARMAVTRALERLRAAVDSKTA